ncbi:MAG: coproporphyrinogen III oxidase family protein [Bacteroidales bacterium]|nr:coproporphyrinogen III oxidase family protein [Bacteroidales bacterium]
MVYVHVPFCKSFCTYCGFYSEKCRTQEQLMLYAGCLEKEIRERKDEIRSSPLRTIYIGGGTPSVLPLDVLRRIARLILEAMGEGPVREFTIEVNPEDIVEKGDEYVDGLLALGVTRISMGIQSFDDRILKWMNRRHDSARAVQAYSMVRKGAARAGRKVDVSIDLIFGVPGLSGSLWEDTVRKAVSLGADEGLDRPDHISAYQLSIEEGSALEEILAKGRCSEIPEDECERQYRTLCSILGAEGYSHYEISNFALPGHEAVHNSGYWKRIPYVGLGPGAHSFSILGEGAQVRSWNSQVIPDGKTAWTSEKEILSEEEAKVERLMLSMRTADGISFDSLSRLADPAALTTALEDGSLTVSDDGTVRIPESRFFVSDDIIRRII